MSLCSSTFNWRTEGQTRIHTAVVTIPNFLCLLDSKLRQIITQEVEDTETKNRFVIKVQLVGNCNDLAEVYYLSTTPVFIKTVLTICLQRFEERTIVMTEHRTIQANKWQYLATLLKRDVVCDTMKFLLGDNSLRLKFQFLVTKAMHVEHALVPIPQLGNDFENLLKVGLFSDIIVKSCDNVEYRAHKAVLSSRSPVLRAALEHDLEERRSNMIQSPLEAPVLEQVLTFIYTDRAPGVNDMAERLLAAADYYQLDRLKCLCEQALYEQLQLDNCIDTLQLADRHSALHLKRSTLQYIKDGRAKEITQIDAWAKFDRLDVLKTIYEFIVTEDEEVDIT